MSDKQAQIITALRATVAQQAAVIEAGDEVADNLRDVQCYIVNYSDYDQTVMALDAYDKARRELG